MLSLSYKVFTEPSYLYDFISLQPHRSTRFSDVVNLVRPPSYSLWRSTTALSAMPHLVSGMNFLKNLANLSMMSPCHCHLIFLSPVHHHHPFHYASLHLWSTPDANLTFSINPSPSHTFSFPHLSGRISRIFITFSGLNCLSVFLLFCSFLFSSFLFDSRDRLSWFYQLYCTQHYCTFLSFSG